MSQPVKRRDIADFFRPHLQKVSKKRSTSDLEADVFSTEAVQPDTRPGTPPKLCITILPKSGARKRTSDHEERSPLATPKSERKISIPIRSPAVPAPFKIVEDDVVRPLRLPGASQASKQIPSSSFPDLSSQSSTQRIFDGDRLVAVKGSDDEDDDSSIESLGDLFARTKSVKLNGAAKPKRSKEIKQEEEKRRMLEMFTGSSTSVKRAPKFDLTSILNDHIDDDEDSVAILRTHEELAESTRELAEMKQTAIDKHLLASIIQHDAPMDEEGTDRVTAVLNAVDRTEALSGERLFSFFGAQGVRSTPRKRRKTAAAFPVASIPGSLWQARDIQARDDHFLSGFLMEQAGLGLLDDNALRWTYNSSLSELREDLQHAYRGVLSAGSPRWTRTCLTPQDIQASFEALGASIDVLGDNIPIKARNQPKAEQSKRSYSALLVNLRTHQVLCRDMDFATLSKLTSLVIRLSVDRDLTSNVQVCHAVEELLMDLADHPDPDSRQHVHEKIENELTQCIDDPTLQALFLHHFGPTSIPGSKLRIDLATKIILNIDSGFRSGISETIATSEPKWKHKQRQAQPSHPLVLLTNHISTSPSFASHSSFTPNYIQLTALTHILDIAISDGHPDLLPSHPRLKPDSNTATTSVTSRNQSEHPAPDAKHERDKLLNDLVDDLAQVINDKFAAIRDTGASHLSRSEAKDALQTLHGRLLYGVRTRPKKKRHLFDVDGQLSLSEMLGKKA